MSPGAIQRSVGTMIQNVTQIKKGKQRTILVKRDMQLSVSVRKSVYQPGAQSKGVNC